MALSNSEKQRILQMLDRMSYSERVAITQSERSLLGWLRRAAKWLWDKFTDVVIGNVINWLMGWA